MKQIKFLVAAILVATTLSASAATVTFTGGANAREGYQQLNADSTHLWSAFLMAGLSGNADNMLAYYSNTTAIGASIGAAILGGNTKVSALAVACGWAGTPATLNAFLVGGGALAMIAKDATIGGINDADYMKKGHYAGLKNENSVSLAANIASDSKKLTGKIEAKFATPEGEAQATRPIDLEKAWLQYDLGVLAVRYDTAGLNSRWDSNVIYVGDYTGQSSLDFQIKPVADMGYAFVTILSDRGLDKVKYQNVQERSSLTPMLSAGYVYESAMVDATVGGVYDKYKGLYNDDYTGYMGFAEVKVKSGQMATEVGSFVVKLAGLYGKNTSRFAGMDPADMEQATLGLANMGDIFTAIATSADIPDFVYNSVSKVNGKDSTVMGGHLSATYTAWMGGMINLDARYSTLKFGGDSDSFVAQRYTLAIIQALDANFFVTLAGGYETYSVDAGDKDYDAAWGYEATLDFGFRF